MDFGFPDLHVLLKPKPKKIKKRKSKLKDSKEKDEVWRHFGSTSQEAFTHYVDSLAKARLEKQNKPSKEKPEYHSFEEWLIKTHRQITARYEGVCYKCKEKIEVGDAIYWYRGSLAGVGSPYTSVFHRRCFLSRVVDQWNFVFLFFYVYWYLEHTHLTWELWFLQRRCARMMYAWRKMHWRETYDAYVG